MSVQDAALSERPSPPRLTCPICDGEGLLPCECVECGAIHQRRCGTCGGSGEITPPFHLDEDDLAPDDPGGF